MDITTNLVPVTATQYAKRYESYSYFEDSRRHVSLYILPNGDILDCRFPKDVKHIGITDMIYGNFAKVRELDKQNELRLDTSALNKYNVKEISLKSVQDALIRNTGVCARNPQHSKEVLMLHEFLSDDDLLVHDLGYVKFLIMGRGDLHITLPNRSINGKYAKGMQLDTIKDIASLCGAHNVEDIIEEQRRESARVSRILENLAPELKR
ncbi:MAG: hypothetical protein IKB42_00715 [Clostridia bacterium]|nr:hypothetical protein [Clostridia bacterium]